MTHLKKLNENAKKEINISARACGTFATDLCGKDTAGCGWWAKDCCSQSDSGECGKWAYDCTDRDGQA